MNESHATPTAPPVHPRPGSPAAPTARAAGDELAFLAAVIETQNDIAAVEMDLPLVMGMIAERTQKLARADGAAVELADGSAATAGHCPPAAPATAGGGSVVAVPLQHGGQVVGVLKVFAAAPRAFAPSQVAGLRLMAGVLAAALVHANEFQSKRRLLAERTAALAALRDSEERFRSAFDHAAIGMALVGLDGRWLRVNASVCRILGYAEPVLLATDFQSITHPEDLGADLACVGDLTAGRVIDYQMLKRYFHRDGHVVWAMLSVSLVRDSLGQPLYFISQIQDITERRRAEEALRASEADYRAIFELAGVGKGQVDLRTGRFLRVNARLGEILGYAPEELNGLALSAVTHPADLAATAELVRRMVAGELGEWTTEKRYLHRDGRVIWVSLNAIVVRDGDGVPTRAVGTIQDITDRKLAEWLEQDRRQVLELVARDAPLPDVLGLLTAAVERQVGASAGAFVLRLQDGNVNLAGPGLADAWREALGAASLSLATALCADARAAAEGCGTSYPDADDAWVSLRAAAAANGAAACWAVALQSADGAPLGMLALFCRQRREPTPAESRMLATAAALAATCLEHHETTRQLAHLCRHDVLTGLPNRILFEDRLQQALALARRTGKTTGLLAIDLDKFKTVNDTLGHQAGDQLLQQFAHRVRACLRDTDTMARLGGDEFAVILQDVSGGRDAAARIAAKLVAAVTKPFDVANRALLVTCSIGIALFPDDGTDAVTLQGAADAALYRAKENGRNGFAI